MKNQNIIRLTALGLGLFIVLAISGTAAAQDKCDTENTGFVSGSGLFGEVVTPGFCVGSIGVIPPLSSANSKGFDVLNLGTLAVNVNIKTQASNVGRSKYKISLRRGSPGTGISLSGTEVANKEVLVGNDSVIVSLTASISSCNNTGIYHVRITNTSTENPQIGQAEIEYKAPALENRNLDMQGTTLTLDQGNESTRTIGSFTKQGVLTLKAKWHVPGILPTYARLSISLLRPDGSVAKAPKGYYSIHYKEGTPRFDTYYVLTEQDAKLTGSWKLKIVNNSDHRIEGFNIEKGTDLNPFVPSFKSTFKTACGQ